MLYNYISTHALIRCVKSEYAIRAGEYHFLWDDRGSGADRDGSLFTNTNTSPNSIGANTFTTFSSHGNPSGRPYLLRAAKSSHGM